MQYLLFLLTLSVLSAFGGKKMPMCHNPQDDFAAFAGQQAFRDAHPTPVPVAAINDGKAITFPVEGGAEGRGYLVKAHKNTNKYLLMFHEWWGLNDNIKAEAVRWSHELGVNVLAVDLYDGKVAATSDEAGQLMQANDKARSVALVRGAARYAGDDARFYTIGWCFGGGWSLQAALALPERTDKCVMYYGMPDNDVERLKTLRCDVLFIHAKQDKWINDQVVGDFEKAMKTAGRKLTVQAYDADHAFANPSGPRYNADVTRQANEATRMYLK